MNTDFISLNIMGQRINLKQSLTVLIITLSISTSYGQSVGVGTANPNPNAALEVDAPLGNQGILITRLSSTQITSLTASLGTVDQGLLVFDTTLNQFRFWDGAAWNLVGYGDNLGNHTATQEVVLKDQWISNDGDKEGVSVSDNGNVTLGNVNTNTTQINGTLQVSTNATTGGTTTSSDFIYKTPQGRIYSVPTAAWNLGTIKTAVMLGGNLNVTGLQSGPSFSNIVAPLNLPHGATIKTAQCYIQNNSGDNTDLRLYQASNGSGSFSSVFGTSIAGTSAWITVDFSGNTWAVNNEASNYFFMVEEKTPTANIIIRGCRIIYDVNTPD